MDERGVLTTHLRSDGRHRAKLHVDGGPSATQTVGHLRMEGKEVFRFAVGKVTDVVIDAFAATGITPSDLDWFVPHQANRRIIDMSGAKARHRAGEGRRHRASARQHLRGVRVPCALVGRRRRRPHQAGDLVMLEAVGGGFTWGSALIRW